MLLQAEEDWDGLMKAGNGATEQKKVDEVRMNVF